jgi:hypothetical protein
VLLPLPQDPSHSLIQVNSRTHVPQKPTGLFSCTNPVSILSVFYSNRRLKRFNPLHRLVRRLHRHTFRGDGSDPFGSATKKWPWEDTTADAMALATRRMQVLFEMMRKLGLELIGSLK